MSPLWRDQIRIVLCPQQAALMRLARGWTPRLTGKRVVACDAAGPGDPPWHNALAALGAVLPEFSAHRADAVVILSNHFVRYALIKHSDEINSADEEQALVRHQFARIYGAAADQWVLRLSDADGREGRRVACAVDRGLHESLLALLQPTSLTLRSIQPYLMAAFNHWRHRFKDSAWFALVEPGRLCLARFQNNRWHSIKSLKIGDDWLRDLAVQMERERFLSDGDATGTGTKIPVFVFAPGCPEPLPAPAEEYSVQLLRPEVPPGDAETVAAPYAMAFAG